MALISTCQKIPIWLLCRIRNAPPDQHPSLDTLSKIAGAMEIALSQFFSESGHSNGSKGLPQLSDDEVRFLSQVRRYATNLNDSDRKLVLAMVKKMAANSK